jgi:hypothetical protein
MSTNPIHEGRSSLPNDLPKGSFLILSHWGLAFNIGILEGHKRTGNSLTTELFVHPRLDPPPGPLLPVHGHFSRLFFVPFLSHEKFSSLDSVSGSTSLLCSSGNRMPPKSGQSMFSLSNFSSALSQI